MRWTHWLASTLIIILWFVGWIFYGRPTQEKLDQCVAFEDKFDSQRTFSAQGQGGILGGAEIVQTTPGVFRIVRPYKEICTARLAQTFAFSADLALYTSAAAFALLLCTYIYFKFG